MMLARRADGGRMYKHLLVPVDDNELFERTIVQSIGLASKLGAKITAFIAEPLAPPPTAGHGANGYVRVMEQHDLETAEHARKLLLAFEQRAKAADVAFEGRFSRVDRIDDAIVETANEIGCDLIVMTTHGRGLFGELLHGSHTKAVLSRCKLPVLVLH
jgi:nucleotide-binding universal stress UspA family protein